MPVPPSLSRLRPPSAPWRTDLFLPWALLCTDLPVMILFVTMGEGRNLISFDVVVLYGFYYYAYYDGGLIHASWRNCFSLSQWCGQE